MPDQQPRAPLIGPAPATADDVSADLLLRDATTVVDRLGSGPDGLTQDEAARRLVESGPNELSVARTSGLLGALVRQLTHPLALLLWAAAVLAATTQGATLAVAITCVIGINAAFALGQERHAEHAVAALAQYLPPHATVVRGGRELSVEARQVVPGDLLVVEEGVAICADAKIVTGAVECDLSAVTGESAPAVRQAGADPQRRLVDAGDVLLSGTTCTSGEARAVVVHTGMVTELGRIAGLSSRTGHESSPLEQQVRRVAWLIAAVAVGVGLAFLPLGVLAGLGLGDAAVFAIGLLVANVPEGLLPTITLALAVGVAELARRGGLVKRLSAVETLGSTDVICTDKTGTLTQNRMQVHSLWGPSGRSAPHDATAEAMATVLRRCTSADPGSGHGDPTELALLKGAERLGVPDHDGTVTRTFHFDPRLRRMSVVVVRGAGRRLCTKGAPESVLELCDTVLDEEGRSQTWTPSDRADVELRLDRLADQGLRLLACAVRQLAPDDPEGDRESLERSLTLVGFAALTDPLRDAVPDAIVRAHRAGITVHVITGDNGRTAGAIALEAGIGAGHGRPHVVNGSKLEAMADDEVDAMLGSGREIVFARNTPEDKLRIASRLQALGHVVAMTGDGVNDAPALRRADIGVAMGRSGTDVAREAATMVLTDDDFATIIGAVQAGRRVYDNVRKFILYIFAHAIPEIVPFLLFALSGGAIPLGLTVTQILLIDLGTETLPALALGREAEEPGIMARPPRRRTEGIITGQMLLRAWALLGIASAVLVTAGFLWVLWSGGWRPGDSVAPGTRFHERYLEATSMTFAGIVACQVGTAMAARTDRVSLFRIGFLTNPLLLLGIVLELALTALVLYTPALQDLLDTRPLGVPQVLALATFPVVVWGVDELYRWRRRSVRT
ncbi:calcium-translocating P-type ATPase [Nocardioides ginsengisegetis]|uniref:Calcium-translocating P-type ATPase n=1 Tax=Nocardioides ginsengisegetis TaxID=661491 RepID=A0A7W3IZC4_9ACTN|nr:cation-transporting P-type ATPase [Nocardioides ginsengisegetis]MBA8803453.1 calcium-translocating P-type ATPase [Nocardioides ginsengisegetis]